MTAKPSRTAPQTAPQTDYDAAISFLAKDDRIAGELATRLGESLNVFYFPRAQEQLAGTDGMESMRLPFLSGSRVIVVLYREAWGATPWTRVEETAIKDGCLQRGWGPLIFVQLDKTSNLPLWLPSTHVRFALEDYGIDQLVGAIKARVQEQGGVVEKPNALTRAKRVQQEADLLAEKQRCFRDRTWIVDTVHKSAHDAVRLAVALVTEGGQNLNPTPRGGAKELHCVLTDQRVTTAAGWKQDIWNDVSRDARFFIRDFRGALALPDERVRYVFQPEVIRERKFVPELTASREFAWRESGKAELLSSEDLGNTIAMAFFDLVSKVNRGKIELPFT